MWAKSQQSDDAVPYLCSFTTPGYPPALAPPRMLLSFDTAMWIDRGNVHRPHRGLLPFVATWRRRDVATSRCCDVVNGGRGLAAGVVVTEGLDGQGGVDFEDAVGQLAAAQEQVAGGAGVEVGFDRQ